MDRVSVSRRQRFGRVLAMGALAVSIAAGPFATGPAAAGEGSVDRAQNSGSMRSTAEPSGRAAPDGAVFVPMSPCRSVDTRVAGGPLGVNETRALRAGGNGIEIADQGGWGWGCPVPSSAVAIEVSVTAVDPQGSGFLRMWPSGGPAATATFLNFTGGQGITNTGTVRLGAGAKNLTLKNFSAASDYVLDVQGYYDDLGDVSAGPDGSVFVPVVPCRVSDTRIAGGRPGVNEPRAIQVAGSGTEFTAQGGRAGGCGVPDAARAVEVSVTAVDPQGSGFFRLRNPGSFPQQATFLNYGGGRSISNTGTVGTSAGQNHLTGESFGAAADYVVDVQGYFVDRADVPSGADGAVFVPVAPCRLVDTRAGGGRLNPNAMRAFQVGGAGAGFTAQGGHPGGCGVPDGAAAAEVSVTAVAPQGSGFFRMWPSGAQPATATYLNFTGGQGITNTGTVGLGSGVNDLTVKNFSAASDYVIDVQGYFVVPASVQVVDVAVGARRSCALHSDGTVSCWGMKLIGLGEASSWITDSVVVPEPILGIDDATEIVTNGSRFCVLGSDGSVTCWEGLIVTGYNDDATPIYDARLEPETVPGLTSATSVGLGNEFSCALVVDGTVSCWGMNQFGQLGNGTTVESMDPVPVTGITDAVDLVVGATQSCARFADGSVECWGSNGNGQLGNGTTVNSSVPVPVTGMATATAIDLTAKRSCALLAGGAIECWGGNADGQLGNGTTTNSSVPVPVTGITNATAIEGGAGWGEASCALLADGTVACWGDNAYGRLGNGTTTSSPVPVPVTGITNATGVGMHGESSCAWLDDGTARCWGRNAKGNLGNGTTTDSPVPTPVVGLTGVAAVGLGSSFACGVRTDGSVDCWGDNEYGQLGNGTTTDSAVPVPVIGL